MNPGIVARQLLGEKIIEVACHSGHADTQLLRVQSASHGEVIIKLHRDRQRHEQEVRAYREWVPSLGDRAPRLVAVSDNPPGIVITAVPGGRLSDWRLTPEQERDAYRQAGQLLTQLHNVAAPREDPTWVGWLADRGRYWLDRAEHLLSAGERAAAEKQLAALERLPATTLVPCHLDFMPYNLVRGDDGIVRAIDFEHARYDLATRDLVRLATRIWPGRPDLAEAFLSEHGSLTLLDLAVIEHCTVIDRLSALAKAGGR
ncbi:aminoglycoside phosphotransferase family protein [Salinispora arenicola]|uniref:aminoglycoside phosphotransferase family protein n=1 Tax=Salinispora arenicola TaxID=168697 RepID=UPI0003601D74|nr:aminoglycoside phosphotransferase family protein [Salinispora arenicola]